MKRIVVFLMGLSLVACSQSNTKDQFAASNQQTAFSASEAAPTAPSTASAAQAGSGGASPAVSDAAQKSNTKAAVTAAATSGQRSSSDNTNRSLTWLFGTIGAMAAFVLATDAITGGQAVGLFGEKRHPQQQKKPEVAPPLNPQDQAGTEATAQSMVPSKVSATEDECESQASGSTASSSIQDAQDVVKFAEGPQASR
jgi:hypothetical protein